MINFSKKKGKNFVRISNINDRTKEWIIKTNKISDSHETIIYNGENS